jgi:DNA-binding SARP family transcriptional activator
MTEDAQRQYQALETILHETLGIGASRESRELYEKIQARG